jgi:hypothetical protein
MAVAAVAAFGFYRGNPPSPAAVSKVLGDMSGHQSASRFRILPGRHSTRRIDLRAVHAGAVHEVANALHPFLGIWSPIGGMDPAGAANQFARDAE